MSSGSNSMIAAFLNPPAITELDASQGLPPSILLDARVYFADRKNSTTATLDTCEGREIQVTIRFAAPPALSYVCIHCPGYTEADFSNEPRVVRSEKQFLLLHLSLWGTGFEELVDEYYMYQAIRGKPKLFPIPDLGPRLRNFISLDGFGIYPFCDNEEFILAGLTYFQGGYRLRSYSSASRAWTAKHAHFELEGLLSDDRMPVAAHKVILLGGSLLGWVDLWKGILVCDVLCQDPHLAVGFIPLPLNRNMDNHICPWAVRDVVACNNGSLKFIEIEHLLATPPPPAACQQNGAPTPDVIYDEPYFVTPLDDLKTEEPCKFVGWRATVWNRSLSENCWRKGFQVHGDDILFSVEKLADRAVVVSTVRNLLPAFPTLSIHGDHVVHMSSSGRLHTGETHMIAIDMSNNMLKALVPRLPVKVDGDCPYFPCVLSNYLSNHSVNPHPAYPMVNTASFGPMVYPFPQNDSRLIQPPSHVNPHPAYPLVNTASFRPMVYPFPQNDSRLIQPPSHVNPHPAYPLVNTTSFRPMVYPFPQNDSRLIQPPSHVNPHPPYPLVNTASFRPMVYPFPQNDSRLIQPPSHVNPHPPYSVANIASFRPMVHSVPQFLQNDLRLLQAPSQVLVPPAHFSTPSVPPALGDTL